MRFETSAGGIVYKKTSQGLLWLMVQHNYPPYHWSFPKGHVGDKKRGETIEEAAIREVQEEGGIAAKIIAPLTPPSHYIFTFQKEKISKNVHYFLMEYVSGSPSDHDTEIREAQFVSFDTIMAKLTHQNDKEQLQNAQKLLG